MAFPAVATTATNFNATSSAPSVTLPSGITAGDLLIAVLAMNLTATVTWPAGWTELANSPQDATGAADRVSVAYRIADGSEGASISPTLSTNRPWASYAYRITAAHASQAPEMSVGVAPGTANVNPDPDSLDPAGWAAEDTLWLACTLISNGSVGVTTYPASYSNGALINTATAGGVGFASAQRQLNATSEDPGTFTLASTSGWRAFTLAVRPAAAGGSTPIAGTDSGTGDDTSSVNTGSAVSAIESGTAADANSGIGLSGVAQTAAGFEDTTVVDVVTTGPEGTGTDASSLDTGAPQPKSATDGATGTDLRLVFAAAGVVADSAAASDAASVSVTVVPSGRRWPPHTDVRWPAAA